jgi:hypothetical protein
MKNESNCFLRNCNPWTPQLSGSVLLGSAWSPPKIILKQACPKVALLGVFGPQI